MPIGLPVPRVKSLRGLWWAVCLLGPLVGAARAEIPAREAVERLVRQLDSESRPERIAAEQQLLSAGPEILNRLPPADLVKGESARAALGRIRQQLELEAARLSIQPRRGTLRGTRTLAGWAEPLAAETGNVLRVESAQGEERFTLDIEDAPFWEILRRAGWKPLYDVKTNQVSIGAPADKDAPPADCSGIFRVAATALRREDQVQITLELWGEPRIRPLYATVADGAIGLTRGDLRSRAVSPDARREVPMTGRGPVTATVSLQFAPARFAQLDGTVNVKTAALPEKVEFDRLTERGPISRRRGGVTVTRHRAEIEPAASNDGERPAGGSAKIRLTVAYDHGGPEFESHRLWLYHNEAWLETMDGTRLPIAPEIDSLEESNGALALDYRFPGVDRGLADLKFVYVVPALILDVQVPFQIRELPIPTEGKAEPQARDASTKP